MSNVDPISSVMATVAIDRERREPYNRTLPEKESAPAASSKVVIDLNDDESSTNKVSVTRYYAKGNKDAGHAEYQKAQQNAQRLAQLPPHVQMYEVVSLMGENDGLASTGRVLNKYL